LVTLLLIASLSFQQLQASAAVDRTELEVGQELVLTLTIAATATQPVRIFNPTFSGFEVQGTTEFREVNVGDSAMTRVMRREIRLKPTQAGTLTIGSVRIAVGQTVATTDPLDITVRPATSVLAPALLPHVRRLIEQREPPGTSPDEVLVEVLTMRDTVMVGDQLDLIVLAWFPRAIRTRLRNPPTMQPPQLQGAWTYPQGAPGAIAASRRIGDQWYDVYAHHQIVFPLTPGPLRIGAAMVSYSLPLTYSFLSREVRHEPQSEPFFIEVLPQPNANRPAAFDGAAGSQLTLEVVADTTDVAVGDATTVLATVSGRGNVALWPEPRFDWPEGLRVYPEAVEVELDSQDDGMWGVKEFRYLVVADAFGTHRISPIRYAYFDLAQSEYVTLTSPALDLFTEGGSIEEFKTDAQPKLPLMTPTVFSRAEQIGRSIPVWALLPIAFFFPILALAMRAIRARDPRRAEPVPPKKTLPEVSGAELNAALSTLVEDPHVLDGKRLANALRACGIDGPVAMHAAKVRDRLWQASYGPEGEVDPEELGAEVEEVLRTLTGRRSEMSHVAANLTTVIAFLFLAVGQAHGQSAERLYETGALKEAADSFRVRAIAEPFVSAHWYNLGNALYARGIEVPARSAWLKALRLDPRDSRIRAALGLEAGQISGDLPWVSPITPIEAFVGAAVLWAVGWMLAGLRRRKRFVLPVLIGALFALGYGGYVSVLYGRAVALVTQDDTPLRAAPFGPAPVVRELLSGSTVIVRNTRPGWVLVERRGDLGWLRPAEIAPL
jgi:hypothetical protein